MLIFGVLELFSQNCSKFNFSKESSSRIIASHSLKDVDYGACLKRCVDKGCKIFTQGVISEVTPTKKPKFSGQTRTTIKCSPIRWQIMETFFAIWENIYPGERDEFFRFFKVPSIL